MQLEQRIRRLEDRESIRLLVANYCRLVDQRDIVGIPLLFTQDGRFESVDGKIAARGREAIVDQFHRRFAVLGPSNHFTHDAVVEFDPLNPDAAHGWVNSHAEVVRNGVALLAALRYEDDYRLEEDRWRFARRTLHFFYYLSPDEYPRSLGQRDRNRAYLEPLPADFPEASSTWQDYYRQFPQR
ncbi:MAG: nuclear transport factor 2 family protein [Gammaproteobacteria bacterium]|jgi:hypothetical protein|nr:nuclear transport factor 2 family protein [Gammaproteobacteria bacterium]